MSARRRLNEYRKYIEKDAALERRFQPIYVGEPSVEDTIAILRGLKERYEVHHHVRITDAALVSAAVLSNRYLTDRFLPDKAIDLVDEAASKLRIEIASMPTEIDEIERRILQLDIEREALSRETKGGLFGNQSNEATRERLEAIERQLADLREESSQLKAQWQSEKDAIGRVSDLKEQLESAQFEIERATQSADLGKAAELRYGTLPQLQRELEEHLRHLQERQGAGQMLKEEVDAEDIAEVVAKWTGVPVARLVESEMQKLLQMEENLRGRVVGQEDALVAVADAVRRSRAGAERSQSAHRFVSVSGADRRRQNRTGARSGRVSVRRRARDGAPRHERIHGETHGFALDRARLRATSATRKAAN